MSVFQDPLKLEKKMKVGKVNYMFNDPNDLIPPEKDWSFQKRRGYIYNE